MRLLLAADLTLRALGRLLLLVAQLAVVVTVVYVAFSPAAALILGVVLVWTLWTIATLGRSR